MPVEEHEVFIPVPINTVLWRYMDVQKFESLLSTKCLFFCRSDKFSDPFEGSLLIKEAEYRIHEHKRLCQLMGQEFDEERELAEIEISKTFNAKFRSAITVNCWQINEYESDAMWQLYLKDNEGIAIQSTYERINSVINGQDQLIGLSKVRYLNYDTDTWFHPSEYPHVHYNLFMPFLHKRPEFKHEHEFRLIYQINEAIDDQFFWDNQPNHKGILVPVDLNLLISKIFLPPTIDTKAEEKIRNLIKSSGLDFIVLKSNLDKKPTF